MAVLCRVTNSFLIFTHQSSLIQRITTSACAYGIKSRWVAPTRRELLKRHKQMERKGLLPPNKRSSFIEWNYDAELYAFGKRLQEEFNDDTLREALTDASYIYQEVKRQQELGVVAPGLAMTSNGRLADSGASVITNYCPRFLRSTLPVFPEEGIRAIADYLTSKELLSEIGFGLGLKDLVLCEEYPPSATTMMRALQAIVGALKASQGLSRAQTFVRDFVISHLNDKDLSAMWEIEEPMEVLLNILRRSGQNEPEPRLIFRSGQNTLESIFHVGLYVDKVSIGSGYGETVDEAHKLAAVDALRRLFQVTDSAQALPFGSQADNINLSNNTNLSLNDWSVEKARNIITC